MTESKKLKSLRDKLVSSTSREELDTLFKKWREEHIEPLKKKIKEMKSVQEKKTIGLELQFLMSKSQEIYDEKKKSFSPWNQQFFSARKSVSKTTSSKISYSSKNLLSLLIQDVVNFLRNNHFLIYEESEIVQISENFDSLLIPEDHPARASSDSFFLDSLNEKNIKMLRTHTTTSTLKILKKYSNTHLRGASLGSVYRKEDNNSTHLSQFTQLDLVWAEKILSFSDLRNLIESLLFSLLGNNQKYRLRPSYFPFTSPSYEVDLSCSCALNLNCRLCKGTGWIEILGCGFLRNEIGEKTHPGFTILALGIGLERVVMIKNSLEDMRLLYRNEFKKLVTETT